MDTKSDLLPSLRDAITSIKLVSNIKVNTTFPTVALTDQVSSPNLLIYPAPSLCLLLPPSLPPSLWDFLANRRGCEF